MVDVTNEVCTKLETIGIPVQLELFLDSETPIPCITYREANNNYVIRGNTSLEYSKITYHIKVWADLEADLVSYGKQVDDLMRQMGFKRTNITELWLDNKGQRDFTYEANAYEYF